MTILAASDKADRLGPEKLVADPDTAPAQHTVFVSKRIADFLHAATHGNVLDGAGVRGLCDKEFRDVAPQFPDSFGIASNHHAFLCEQRAGGGYLRSAAYDMLNDAEAAGTDI